MFTEATFALTAVSGALVAQQSLQPSHDVYDARSTHV
jgi:hypothetical protein